MPTEEELNRINGSSSALGEGSFRRRDELRRAEAVQRQKVKMGERLDRNIARASRTGDGASLKSFISARQAITGQAYGGQGGITSADDREQRVADGTLKGSKIRHDFGNIGATNNGMIAEAPPADSATPKNRPEWDNDGNGVPNSIQRPGIAAPKAQGAPVTPPVAPSSQMTPETLKSRQAFATDLDRSEVVKNDPKARERAYKRGESIGVSRGEVNRRQGWGGDTGPPKPTQDFNVEIEDGQEFQPIDSGGSQFDELTQGAPKKKEDLPLLSAYNQDSNPPSLSRESVFGKPRSKSARSAATEAPQSSFGQAVGSDIKAVYDATKPIRDIPSGIRQQIRYGALDVVGAARKTYAAAQETGPSMVAQYLPGAVGEWARKKSAKNFQSLGKRSREIDDSILKAKNAITSYQQPPTVLFPR